MSRFITSPTPHSVLLKLYNILNKVKICQPYTNISMIVS